MNSKIQKRFKKINHFAPPYEIRPKNKVMLHSKEFGYNEMQLPPH